MRVKIEQIAQSGGIYKIYFSHSLCGVFLSLPNSAQVGASVQINFKASEAMISKKPLEISAENEILAKILDIKFGEILSNISLSAFDEKVKFDIITTTSSAQNLGICVGDEIYAYINASAIYIEKIDDKD